MNQVSKEGALLPDTSTNTFMAEWTQKAELWKMVISIMMHLWIVFFFFLSHHLIPDTHGGWWWWWWWWYTSLATTNDTGVVSSHYTTNETAKNKSFLRDNKKKKENEGSSLSTGDINSKLHKFNVQSRPCFPISRFT